MRTRTRLVLAHPERPAPLLCLALASLLLPACTCPAKPEPILDSSRVITIEGPVLRYNGQVLSFDVPADDWQKILGPRSRRVNDISVWDDLGVLVYHASKGERRYGKPTAFVVALGPRPQTQHTDEGPAFWPKTPFRGRLVVDGALIHKDSTINEIVHDKKGASFRSDHSWDVYRYDGGDYGGWLGFAEDRTVADFEFSLHVSAR